MIDALRVENFAVIARAELSFHQGLNVFTGETGAGKSLLVDALLLLSQKKVPPHALRAGGEALLVEALFSRGEEEWVLRREVREGRSVCRINGQLVPQVELQARAEDLFTIYGQNEHLALLQPARQRDLLDACGAHTPLLEELARLSRELARLQGEMNELRARRAQVEERRDFLAFQVAEVDELDLDAEGAEDLRRRLEILRSAEEILLRSVRLQELSTQAEDSIHSRLDRVLRDLDWLERLYPELGTLREQVALSQELMNELSFALARQTGGVECDPEEMDRVQSQLSRLERLERKHRCPWPQILDLRQGWARDLASLEDMDSTLERLERETSDLFKAYQAVHERLRAQRKATAQDLSVRVEEALRGLEMPRARFRVEVEDGAPGPGNTPACGADRVLFLFSSNPGQDPAPLREVASGGELSRLMLVLKSLGDGEGGEETYIFDEVDTGIGGRTAASVGERLAAIAQRAQVLCISHLPQIAAHARRHYLIRKEYGEDETFSTPILLEGEDRVRELARLMSGRDDDPGLLEAARNLLEGVAP